MEGMGIFPPWKGLREDPGLPLSLEGAKRNEGLGVVQLLLKNPTPQPKGVACGVAIFVL